MDGAALPGAAKDLRDRRLQPGVRVADRELNADQAAPRQAVQEADLERFRFGLADIEAEDHAPPDLTDAMGDHRRLVDHPAANGDLLHLGAKKQLQVAALQRPRAERVDVRIQRGADAADPRSLR